MKKSHILAVDCILTLISSGVLSQFSPPTGEICSGDNVTFTCVVNTALGIWVVRLRGEETECLYRRSSPGQDNCGPGDRFMSNATDVNEDINSSFLRVDSITIDLNDTQVKCNDGNEVTIGSNEICIIGNSPAPQILSATISELGMCDDDGCVVTVRWREPFISCDGSVSQYVLTVTPPTCDCESLQNCKLMDNAAVYFMPGNETQYDIAVNGNISLEYDMTVRADTCDNSLTGDISPVYSINLIGVPRTTEPFSYHYVFNIITRDIMAINVSWPRVDILNGEAETAYRIVIIPGSGSGSGNEMFFDIVTADNCTDDSCSYIFSSDSITNSYSVAVEVVGCVTERMNSTNMSSLCDPEALKVLLPSNDGWSDGLGMFTFSGGRVTFNGVSYGSVATYTTTGDYRVNGEQSFQTVCLNNTWVPPAVITTARCNASDLLGVLESDVPTDGTCSELWSDGLSVRFCNTSIMTTAEYNTLPDYCIVDGPLVRQCMDDQMWSGQTPLAVEVCDSKLKVWNIAVLVIGLVAFISGVVVLGTLMFLRVRKSAATVKRWYQVMVAVSVIITIISLILWLGLIGYTVSNDFCEDGRRMRGSNSQCEPPSGDNAVRDALVIVSCVLSLLVLIEWSVSATLWRYGVITDADSTTAPPLPPPVTYEEVGVSEEVKSTHNIQLQSNEAYGPIQRDNIHTSPNTAYGQVQL